ncbi:MAG: phosphatidylglycerophosphatase A [Nitrospirae bacterium]|nr:phosphatidylglycerophosphatase A [Nitrospirota bacterium]
MRVKEIVLKNIATLTFIGYSPIAPGTAGTAVTMLFVYLLKPSTLLLLLLIVISFIIGVISSTSAEITFKKKDCSHIIIDEFVGSLITIAFIPQTPYNLILAFFAFRFFDILKPPPARQFEYIFKRGLGVMMDDVAAGIYANIAVAVIIKMVY